MSALLRRAVLIGCVAFGGCVAHPVGPARTFDDYQRKARTSAESVLSAVESARLAAAAAEGGKSFGPYATAVITEAEGAASGVQGTFDSIQPPGDAADRLRTELDELLASAAGHLTDLRIAARRGTSDGLRDEARPLVKDAADLRKFLEEHQ